MAKILIVDDEKSTQSLLKNILQKEHHQTFSAENGKAAVEMLEKEIVDLILMDIMMPIMDGVEAFEKLQQNPTTKDIPIIMLSASASELDMMRGMLLGPLGYIDKPINPQKLLNLVSCNLNKN